MEDELVVDILRWAKQWVGGEEPLSTGVAGEREAEVFLKKLGHRVLARNWRSPADRRDELDLVCRDGEVLVFVEVKTRSAGALVTGYYAVDRRKKEVLRRAANSYMKALPPAQRPRTFRLDVVEVTPAAGPLAAEVRHFENVPLFSKHYRP